jgi:hypothetical protein
MTREEFEALLQKLGGMAPDQASQSLDAPSVEIGMPQIQPVPQVEIGEPIIESQPRPINLAIGPPQIERRRSPAIEAMRRHMKRAIGGL